MSLQYGRGDSRMRHKFAAMQRVVAAELHTLAEAEELGWAAVFDCGACGTEGIDMHVPLWGSRFVCRRCVDYSLCIQCFEAGAAHAEHNEWIKYDIQAPSPPSRAGAPKQSPLGPSAIAAPPRPATSISPPRPAVDLSSYQLERVYLPPRRSTGSQPSQGAGTTATATVESATRTRGNSAPEIEPKQSIDAGTARLKPKPPPRPPPPGTASPRSRRALPPNPPRRETHTGAAGREEDTCVVCMEARRSVCIVPCGACASERAGVTTPRRASGAVPELQRAADNDHVSDVPRTHCAPPAGVSVVTVRRTQPRTPAIFRGPA